MEPTEAAPDGLAVELSKYYAAEPKKWEIEQLHHRLDLLRIWTQNNFKSLEGRTVLEIGCGQGDMTVALAHAVGSQGKVIALDPAPLDYGSPTTLGEAQAFISSSKIGGVIEWVQRDPIEYFDDGDREGLGVEFIVLAHALFYMPSEGYTLSLLRKCREVACSGTKLLLAEWGMRASNAAAEAHVLGVKAQMTFPLPDANIRTVLEPQRIKENAQKAGWRLEREIWIEDPELDDGGWEVVIARELLERERVGEEVGGIVKEIDNSVKKNGDLVRSMDVWTGVFCA